MPIVMNCPFMLKDKGLNIHCEGAKLKFPDNDARREFVRSYCAHSYNWAQCQISKYMRNYYDRKDEGK